jgi:hypothetical protein
VEKPVDTDSPNRYPHASFAPDRRLTAVCGGGVLIFVVLALTNSDSAGRLLFGLAAALFALYVVTDLVFAPRLFVDAGGLTVRTPFLRAALPWAEVERVVADSRQRYGLRSVTLEIDAGEHLIVLSRRALGEDPELVAERVAAFTPQR